MFGLSFTSLVTYAISFSNDQPQLYDWVQRCTETLSVGGEVSVSTI